MSQFFQIHPENPQPRLVKRAVDIVESGGVIVYPTDSCYAFGWHIGNKDAMQRIARIRKTDSKHNFTLVCRDLSDISLYSRLDNSGYRLLKSLTPGPYTFVLKASREVPRRLQNPKRRTIGIRVPDNAICSALLDLLGQPMMSSTLILPPGELPETDPELIRERLEKQVELIIDGGNCGFEPTTVMVIARQGKGDVSFLNQ